MKRKQTICGLLLCCILCCVLAGSSVWTYAETKAALTAEVTLLKQDTDALIQVQVKNTGEDFEGTVRVVFNGTTDDNGCAFDQWLALPKNGEKQYTFTVPSSDINQTRGAGIVAFLDKKDHVVESETFSSIFGKENRGIPVGILSDHFDQLGWLGMSGQTYYLHGRDQNMYLLQLDADHVQEQLDQLYFLVIDQFDVSTLGADTIQAIQTWVDRGGWLLIGTGEREADTLEAFDPQFTQVTASGISQPGESNDAQKNMQMQNSYYGFKDCGIDFTKMAVASLNCSAGNAYNCDAFPGWVVSYGAGAIGVAAISFGEKEMQKASSDLCYNIYDQVASYSTSISQYQNDEEWSWNGRNAFHAIDSRNTSLDFSWLKVLIIGYVIVVGPVLYLVLRKVKKRDWYWLGVPALGLVFIGIVFIAGHNLKLHDTKVYAVTAQQADGKESGKITTLYNAYHSGVRPWSIKLKDGYEYAGTGMNEYSGVGTKKAEADQYHYRILYDNGLTLGVKPQSNFENAYLFAAGTAAGCGEIKTEHLVLTQNQKSGTVTNNTKYDFPYLLLLSNDYMVVLSDVKAGENIDLATNQKNLLLEQIISYSDDVYTVLSADGYNSAGVTYEHPDLASALYLGLCQVMRQNDVSNSIVVAGVADGYEKTVTGKCSERSFGCLYTIANQEVSDASN